MLKKTETEMERAKIIKVTRQLIRLKHSLAADEELNDVLPDRLAEFDNALQSGELKQVDELLNVDI
jgi:hypothetical protein